MSDLDTLVEEAISEMPEPSPFADKIVGSETSSNGEHVSSHSSAPISNPNPVTVPLPDSAMPHVAPVFDRVTDSAFGIIRDSKGTVFDATIHGVAANGQPSLNQNGSFRKKRGVKVGVAVGVAGPVPIKPTSAQQQLSALQAGKATAEAIFALSIALGGEEWRPIVSKEHGINEPQQMQDAFASYYLATGRTDLPPWVVVAIALASYSLPRVRLPQTQSRAKRAWDWIKSKMRKDK